MADAREEWLLTAGCDGFDAILPYLPEGLDGLVDKGMPERPRSANRFFQAAAD